MFARRGIRLLVVIICVIAVPSVAALGWHSYTQDPTLRPLGITKADLNKQEADRRTEVVAHLRWDGVAEAKPSDTFARSLVQAFGIKNINLHVIITDASNQGTSVTFEVGASRIGPFTKAKAVKGVNGAIAAYYMLAAHPLVAKYD